MLHPSAIYKMKTRKFLPHSLPPVSLSDTVNDGKMIESTSSISEEIDRGVLVPEIENVMKGEQEVGLDEKRETKGMAAIVLKLRNQITTQKVIIRLIDHLIRKF